MLNDLLSVKKTASLDELLYLLSNVLSCDTPMPIGEVRALCASHTFRFAMAFSETIKLLETCSIIKQSDKDIYLDCEGNKREDLVNPTILCRKIVDSIIHTLVKGKVVAELFNHKTINYDVNSNSIAFNLNMVAPKMGGVKQILINLGFLIPQERVFGLALVSHEHHKFFEDRIIPLIDNEEYLRSSGLSQETLKKIIANQEAGGELAEEWVVKFEQERLQNHSLVKTIRRISLLDVAAGFDVVSFNDEASMKINRLIEVKSYAGKLQFYWTKNEIKTAQLRGDKYFLYLVDRSKMDEKDYEPEVIQNPFERVYMNEDWEREVQVYLFKRKKE